MNAYKQWLGDMFIEFLKDGIAHPEERRKLEASVGCEHGPTTPSDVLNTDDEETMLRQLHEALCRAHGMTAGQIKADWDTMVPDDPW